MKACIEEEGLPGCGLICIVYCLLLLSDSLLVLNYGYDVLGSRVAGKQDAVFLDLCLQRINSAHLEDAFWCIYI